ncbi:CASP-like protein 1C3 [Diospyros lotus]|uniref:CASP-like protein 1C3 n=1 Tax=Diospyros lotus TaxID=55363 RepID=UPI0022500A3F|nr:CASP-like protein 1C3 [Diospyros lotus]
MQLPATAKTRRICTSLLRLLAVGSTAAAAIVMATSREKASVFAFTFEAKYSHTPAFKYFLIANVIGCVYSFLVILLPAEGPSWRFVVALDAVITMLLTSSISAALAVAEVGKKGNSYAGWLPICGQVEKYCHHVAGALAAGFAAVILYMLLLIYSIQAALKMS